MAKKKASKKPAKGQQAVIDGVIQGYDQELNDIARRARQARLRLDAATRQVKFMNQVGDEALEKRGGGVYEDTEYRLEKTVPESKPKLEVKDLRPDDVQKADKEAAAAWAKGEAEEAAE